MNTLYYGDNLDVMRRHLKDESVDLVYLDPPFNSNANYNVLFQEHDKTKSGSQVMAFEDTWHWDQTAALAYQETVESGGRVADVMRAFRTFLGTNDMLAYLSMMAPRLVEIRRIMKPAALIYLHCDPTASHYLKLLMDGVFGPTNFRNEIIWKRQSAHSDAKKRFANVADIILFYGRSQEATFHPQYVEHDPQYLTQFYRHNDGDGRGRYRLGDMSSPNPRPRMTYEWKGFPPPVKGWRYQTDTMQRLDEEGRIWYPTKPDGTLDHSKRPQLKRYLSEQTGSIVTNVWNDINLLHEVSAEKLGYPTQKPLELLERIISASSNPGDIVFDPFCGCGTTVDAAQKLGRQWIGIDITHLAIGLIRHRLRGAGIQLSDYKVIGEPTDLSGAKELAETDPYQFQWWALGLLGARPTEQKKGADRGIDGRLYFHDDSNGETKQIIFSVKAGKVQSSHVRDLVGVINRENAQIGVLISLN